MINHLKVAAHKGIKSLNLYDLGKINIICGKNNSGKSSILEGLNKSFIPGVLFNIQSFYEKWLSGQRHSDHSFLSKVHSHMNVFFDKTLKDNYYVIFKDEYQNLAQEVTTILNADFSVSRYKNFYNDELANLLAPYFKAVSNTSSLLIPAKRILEYESSISLNQNISAEGNGILNRLFFLKNQDLASADFILYTQIHHVFKSITGFDFNIVPNQNNNILLKFKIHNEWLIADQCGLGFRELLSMITQISISKKEIILLEEPENHLHADFQKKFISFLKEQHDKQFIISTHSNVFIDHSFIDKVYYCWYDEEVKISDKTTTSKIIDSLGYSIAENLTADAIILTEGPTDIPILKRALTLNETITNYNIKFWPLGGDIMGESDLSIFKGLNKVFAIIDSDPGSSKIRNKFQKNCEDHSITCYKLDRYSIENYIPLNIIKDQFPSQITIKNLDDTLSVDEQIGFKQKNKSIKQKNAEMALRVELKDIQETDLHRICNEIKNILMSKKEAGTNNVSEK